MSPSCENRALVDAHFEGGLSPAREHALREHLPTCAACRARYERHLLLEKLDPSARGAEERLARGLGFAPRRTPWFAISSGLAAAAAAAAVLLVLAPGTRSNDGFHERGGTAPPAVDVRVYEVHAGHAAPVGSAIPRNAELAFSYANRSSKRYLMIFAVDEHRHVYWYFPSWTDPAQDPQAVAVTEATTPSELPDAVTQELDGSTLHMHALFLDQPETVKQVEAQLASGALKTDGALTWSLELKVDGK